MLTWIRRIVLAGVALVVLTVAAGVAYEQWSRWSAMRVYPPVGELVETNGSYTHLHCTGQGQPTVVLESGLSVGGSLDWALVQPSMADFARVCSYDRAGILWSDRRRGPRDGNRIATELHAVLEAAAESPPYIMVGHSIGGPLARVFASHFEDEVVGFVFIDSSHPDQYDRYRSEGLEDLVEPPWSFIDRIRAATGLYRLGGTKLSLPGLSSTMDEVIERLQPKTVAALAREAAVLAQTLAQAGETGSLGDRPLVVLTAGRQGRSSMDEAARVQVASIWFSLQNELATLSSNSVQRTITDAHHYIQFADPEAVVAAVQDVLAAVQDGTSVGGEGS